MRSLCLLSFAVCLLTTMHAEAKNREKIAVLDIQTTNIDEKYIAMLTEVLTAEVAALRAFDVIAGRDITAMLGLEQQKQLMGCDEASCIAEIGGALGADKMLVGHIGKLGDTYIVNIKLINIASAETDGRIYEPVTGKIDVLIGTIKRSVARLFEEVGPGKSRTGANRSTPTNDRSEGQPAVEATPTAGTGPGVLSLTLLGAGVVAAGVGVVFGLKANSHRDNANDSNFDGAQLEIDKGKSAKLVANIAYGGAAALLAAGLLTWMLGSDDAAAMSLLPAFDDDFTGVVFSTAMTGAGGSR